MNSQNLKLYQLILNTFILDELESSYLSPLLEQTGLYSGHLEIILTTHKLSQKVQKVYFFTKKIKKKLRTKYKYLEKTYNIYFYYCIEVFFMWDIDTSYHNILFKYKQLYLLSLQIFVSYKYFYELLQPKISKFKFNFIKQDIFEESIFRSLIFILLYKVWKAIYWYPLISKIAFDCQEIKIAKYFAGLANLEVKMIYMLIMLFH